MTQQHSGLYFDQIGQIKLIRNHYDIVTYIDLEQVKEKTEHFRKISRKLSETCYQIDCEPKITTLRNLMNKIDADLDSLTDTLSNRVKRSWYGVVKDTVKIIHGIINGNEMEMVESLIKQNLNNNTAVNELQGRIGILKSDLSKHHEKLVKLDNIIMDFYVKLHNLGLDGRLVKNELDKLKLEQYLQTVGSYALTVHNDIQTIITARLFAKTILSRDRNC